MFEKIGWKDTITECLLKIFNRCIEISIISGDWIVACIILVYKERGDRNECANYIGISSLRIPVSLMWYDFKW